MTRLFLIRHTQAEGNLYRMMQGQWDGPITALGRQQIDALSERFQSMPVDADPMYFVPAGGPNTYVMIDGSVQRGREPKQMEKDAAMIGYRRHFATCPAADSFRKKRKGEAT